MPLMTALRWSNLLSEPAMGACQKQKSAAIRAPLPEDIGLIPGSSVVEQLTVNQLVGGSNPSRGAINFNDLNAFPSGNCQCRPEKGFT